MAAKPRKTQRKSQQKEAPAVGEMHGGVFVQGGIYAKRDVIMRDQYNLQDQRIAHIQTPAEFVEVMAQLQIALADLKKKPELTTQEAQTVEIVEGQVQQAIEEAQKPQPMGARIAATLSSAKATMDLISGAVQSAVALGATLAGLAQIALKIFGG